MNQEANRLLFLCTGNYYRSRFAEEYFNQRVTEMGLPWIAESRGLAEQIDAFSENHGPISIHALRYLQLYLVEPRMVRRYPMRAEIGDFDRSARVIALSRREHEPMLEARFPQYVSRVEYFDIEDIGLETPASAIPRLVHQVDHLIDCLAP